MVRVALVACALAACGGKTAVQDARSASHAGSDAGSAASAIATAPAGAKGDAQIRVEWKDPPAPARASPGRTPCHTARRPDVAPTSTWGVPDAVVWLDVAPIPPAPARVRVALSACTASPRVAVAHPGDTLAIASTGAETTGPLAATVMHYGDPSTPNALAGFIQSTALPVGAITRLQLAVVGHEVDLPLAAPAIDALAGSDPADGEAWVLTTAGAAGVTDASGQLVLRDLPVGAHAVTAWLPRSGTFEAKVAHGKIDILPGGLAEVTLDLAAGAAVAPGGSAAAPEPP